MPSLFPDAIDTTTSLPDRATGDLIPTTDNNDKNAAIIQLETKVGVGAAAAADATTGHSLKKKSDGTTGWEGTTKADVGLGSVPNTDATKRANHTGTQTANTISNFQATVSANDDVSANTAVRHDHDNKEVLDATTASFTTADESKLDGIAAQATKNATDAQLRSRSTHTGSQAASTISDFQTAVSANSDVAASKAASHSHNNKAILDGTTASYTESKDSKLSSLQDGATANDTDANLKNRANHTGTQTASTISNFNTAADARITAQKGQNNGLATLDGSGKVPSSQLPSAVSEVLEFDDTDAFPSTGSTGTIYVARDTNRVYRWDGSAYTELSPGPDSSDDVPEGDANLYFSDELVEANSDVAANTAARHSHTNKSVLDSTTASFTTALKNKVDGIAAGAEVNVQADFNESNSSSDAFIKNKPTLGSAAAASTTDFATAEQGALAESAIQPDELGELAAKDKVAVADIDATGTPSSTTYYKGDGSWAEIEVGDSLPDQAGNSGKWLTTDGADPSWAELPGGGDMVRATYDPNSVAADAFDMDNMVEGDTNKILSPSERSKLADIEADAQKNVPSDWNASSGDARILNKPALFDGDYDSLSNKPTLGSASSADTADFATATQGGLAASAVQPEDLATVATSGSYDDLTNRPSIPSAQVQSDWDATSGLGQILNKPTLGTAAAADLDTDATLAADSDTKVPSQKAIKAYVAANAGGGEGGTAYQNRLFNHFQFDGLKRSDGGLLVDSSKSVTYSPNYGMGFQGENSGDYAQWDLYPGSRSGISYSNKFSMAFDFALTYGLGSGVKMSLGLLSSHTTASIKNAKGVGCYTVFENMFYAHNGNGSSTTKTDIKASLTQAYQSENVAMVYNPGVNVKYYMKGVLAATHTNNLPTGVFPDGVTVRIERGDGNPGSYVATYIFEGEY